MLVDGCFLSEEHKGFDDTSQSAKSRSPSYSESRRCLRLQFISFLERRSNILEHEARFFCIAPEPTPTTPKNNLPDETPGTATKTARRFRFCRQQEFDVDRPCFSRGGEC